MKSFTYAKSLGYISIASGVLALIFGFSRPDSIAVHATFVSLSGLCIMLAVSSALAWIITTAIVNAIHESKTPHSPSTHQYETGSPARDPYTYEQFPRPQFPSTHTEEATPPRKLQKKTPFIGDDGQNYAVKYSTETPNQDAFFYLSPVSRLLPERHFTDDELDRFLEGPHRYITK